MMDEMLLESMTAEEIEYSCYLDDCYLRDITALKKARRNRQSALYEVEGIGQERDNRQIK